RSLAERRGDVEPLGAEPDAAGVKLADGVRFGQAGDRRPQLEHGEVEVERRNNEGSPLPPGGEMNGVRGPRAAKRPRCRRRQGVLLSLAVFDRSEMLPVAISLSQEAFPRAEASQR